MAVIPYGVSTELDAVNSILMSVGETPVNTLTVQSPEVAIAQKTLRQVCREIQAEGWSYNTENEYPIQLDTNNQCIIPNNVLQLDLNIFEHGKDYDVVRRSDNGVMKIYDKKNHTFTFENCSKLYFDIVWMFNFEDLPKSVQAREIAMGIENFSGDGMGGNLNVYHDGGDTFTSMTRQVVPRYMIDQDTALNKSTLSLNF